MNYLQKKQNLTESVHESMIFELSCVQNAFFRTTNVVWRLEHLDWTENLTDGPKSELLKLLKINFQMLQMFLWLNERFAMKLGW